MWVAENWKDYEVLDCSKGEKLERWGDYLLVRPDPQVLWDTPERIRAGERRMGIIIEATRAEENGNSFIYRNSGRSDMEL